MLVLLPSLALTAIVGLLAFFGARRVARRMPRPPPPDGRIVAPAILVTVCFLGASVAAPYLTRVGSDRAGQDLAVRDGDAPLSVREISLSLTLRSAIQAISIGAIALFLARTGRLRPGDQGLTTGGARGAVFALLMLLAFTPIYYAATLLNQALLRGIGIDEGQHLVRSLFDHESLRNDPVLLFQIALLVPLIEEVVFRGYLQRALRAVTGPGAAIAASALVFAIIHDPPSIVPVFTLAVCLGSIAERTGSAIPAAVAHAAFNASQLALLHHLAG